MVHIYIPRNSSASNSDTNVELAASLLIHWNCETRCGPPWYSGVDRVGKCISLRWCRTSALTSYQLCMLSSFGWIWTPYIRSKSSELSYMMMGENPRAMWKSTHSSKYSVSFFTITHNATLEDELLVGLYTFTTVGAVSFKSSESCSELRLLLKRLLYFWVQKWSMITTLHIANSRWNFCCSLPLVSHIFLSLSVLSLKFYFVIVIVCNVYLLLGPACLFL